MIRANQTVAEPLPGERPDPARRALLAAGAALAAGVVHSGCAAVPATPLDWEPRLAGTTWALLGEVHDNPEHHRLRAAALQRACAAGWRPAIVMEQFDLDRQADIDRARGEEPHNAQHLIAQAGAARGWRWSDYEPFVALALQHGLPLLAGNLPRATASRLAREDYDAALGPERVRAWRLEVPPDARWQAAQEREIDFGHCGALPRNLWAGMARAQFARDAAMAELLQRHGAQGAVLLAGNGHVRRDLGVPRWIARHGPAAETLVVGFVERDTTAEPAGRYDAVVVTARAERADPCEAFKRRPSQPAGRVTSSRSADALGAG